MLVVSRAVLVVAALAPYLAWAQLGGPPDNSAVETCECSPACEGGGGCRGRVVERADCPCCKVCAQQEGDPCSHPSLPCDAEYGLVCSPEGVCKAEFPCTYDGECPSDRFCLGGVCVDPCPILTPCQGVLSGRVCVSKDHRPVCECPAGTLVNSEANVCIPYNGTAKGCEHEGRLYGEGEVRYAGQCQEQCRCTSDGTFSCGPVTCPPGLFLAGQHSQQELCIELRNRPETDECCVVVACANSLAQPTVLTAPGITQPGSVPEDEPQRGRMVGPDPLPPITEHEYQKRLRDLEDELGKKNDKKKVTDVKAIEKFKPVSNNNTAVTEDVINATVVEVVTELSSVTQEENVTIVPEEDVTVQETVEEVTGADEPTTLTPVTEGTEEPTKETDEPTKETDEPTKEGEEPAVVLEYDDSGDLLHRITVQEHVEVVTHTPQDLIPATLAPHHNDDDDDLSLAREGKKVQATEANATQVELPFTESPKTESKGGSGSLKVVNVTRNSSTVLLPSSKGGEVYYKAAEGSEWQREMVNGGEDSLVLRNLSPSTQYALKWSGASGGSAKTSFNTLGVTAGDVAESSASAAQANARLPKLLVTEKTHNSVTLAWDDFRARTYEGGYVAEYREERGNSEAGTTVEQPWMRKEVPTGELPPKLTVEGLKPNTLYEVRVSIYDDVEEGRLGEATETINVRTEAGCMHGNASYPVGEFYNGCEERCMCSATGAVRCFERCTLPYLRAGSFRGDPLCSEQPDERDECCVLVRCASGRREAYNQCTNVVCGPNAECISGIMASKDLSLSDVDSDLTLGYCRCLAGFTGDASDLVTGCMPDPSAGHKEGSCTFKNSTYRLGDIFYDNCDYRCSCSNNSEIECQPRCEFPMENSSEPEPGCKYLPDPQDSCCKLRTCNSTSNAVGDATRAPSLPSDGCTDGNITYAKNEKFYNGCETQCICMGFGDVSCFPRCPPLKVVSETPKRCETLPDPLDPCCSITVCDEPTPDVMKANITELEKEMMKNMTEIEKEMMMKEMMNMTAAEKIMMMRQMMNITEEENIMMKNLTDMQEPQSENATMVPEGDMLTTSVSDENILVQNHSADNVTASHGHEHTHEDGVTHSHPHEHSENETHNHTSSHQIGQVESRTNDEDIVVDEHQIINHGIFNGTHNHTHTHENGVTHTHPHEHNMDNLHDHVHDMNDTHEHTHPHDHTHDNDTNVTHTHEHTHADGTTHSHPHDHSMDHTHDNATNVTHAHEHTHEDGTTHSHPHDHSMDHTHDNATNVTHAHEHTHEDGTTHSHPHDHTHDNTTNVIHDHEHTHEDGTTHSHPHDHSMDHTHDNTTNVTHAHEHTHEDGTTHSHPHEDMNKTDTFEHTMTEGNNFTHMHENGVFHTHPHDQDMGVNHSHTNMSDMDEVHKEIHTHEDGVTHGHPHKHDGVMVDPHNHTHVNILEKKNRAEDLGSHDLNILEVMAINSTTVMIKVAVSDSVMDQVLSSEDQKFMILYSPDSLTWSERNISVSDAKVENFNEIILYLNDLQPSTPYQFRVAFQDFVSSTSKARLMDGAAELDGVGFDTSAMCSRNGRYYKPGEDFYEGCSQSCMCTERLDVHCAAIECPVTFGLELIDPNCLEWDLDPDYVPTPPKCCAQVKCISSSACHYMGQMFNNYDQIPRELTGCSQVCTCNYGNVTCRDLCDPVPAIPPPELNCEPQNAVLITLPGETCCRSWQCTAHTDAEPNITLVTAHFDDLTNTTEVLDFFAYWGTTTDAATTGTTELTTTDVEDFTEYPYTNKSGFPAIFPLPPVSVLSGTSTSGFVPIAHPATPSFGSGGINEPGITPLDAKTVHFFFSTPSLYQGLPGELLIRFTADPTEHSDVNTWSQEVLVPMGSIIGQSEWDHILTGLQPSTEYAMQIVLTVQGTKPITSPVFTYTTMDEATTLPTTTPLPRLDINAELYASAITKTSAKVSWRGFNDFELQYIDGVQVKYTEKDKLIPKFSQLFHRDNNQMDLRDLLPGHSYTVDLVFITHENQTTQVTNTEPKTFTTLPEEDPYAFEIEVTAGKVGSQTAELFYSGVPEPEEKYISVYRAVYLREDERVDADTFKVPKTGLERKLFLSELKPDVEYQVWLEAYLSNGRKKKSNVLTITTRAGELPKPERSEVDPSAKSTEDGDGYYPALVAVAIIAAIACLGFLGLLVILLRKQSHAKAHINSSRNNAAYDNPSYKVGDNTYDMEMNGIKGSGNGATHAEEP
nr:putative epidermal cell surface receptor isoform X12 [Procambarus clarkii]